MKVFLGIVTGMVSWAFFAAFLSWEVSHPANLHSGERIVSRMSGILALIIASRCIHVAFDSMHRLQLKQAGLVEEAYEPLSNFRSIAGAMQTGIVLFLISWSVASVVALTTGAFR